MSWHSKIIIAGIVIFRGFLLSVLWFGNDIQEYKEKYYKKLLNIVSFLYNICLDYIKNLAPTHKGNKEHVAEELKVTNAHHIIATTEEERAKHKIKKEQGREQEIIEGFYGKNQLDALFTRKELVDSIRVLIDCWLELLYEQSHEEWQEIQRSKKKSKTVKFSTAVFDF
jgi:hypothetical protein